MKRLILICSIITLFIVSPSLIAGWYTGKIQKIQVDDTTVKVFVVKQNVTRGNCSYFGGNPHGFFLPIDGTEANKRKYSIIMAAYALGKTVQIRSNTKDCWYQSSGAFSFDQLGYIQTE